MQRIKIAFCRLGSSTNYLSCCFNSTLVHNRLLITVKNQNRGLLISFLPTCLQPTSKLIHLFFYFHTSLFSPSTESPKSNHSALLMKENVGRIKTDSVLNLILMITTCKLILLFNQTKKNKTTLL